MTSLDLSQGWSLAHADRPRERSRHCSVPCSVLSVLREHGEVPDPLAGTAIPDAARNALEEEWIFVRTFDAPPAFSDAADVRLELDSLDTRAEVSLGNVIVARASDAWRPLSIPVRDALKPGRNVLRIRFLRETRETAPDKPALAFGAPWSPALPDRGIAGGVRLRAWSGARLASAGCGQRHATAGPAELLVGGWVERQLGPVAPDAASLVGRVKVRDPAGAPIFDGRASMPPGGGGAYQAVVPIATPRLWWPAGLGDQPLYEVEVSLFRFVGRGTPARRLDSRNLRIGLRTLRTEENPDGNAAMRCNGRAMFLRGAVWAAPPACVGPTAAASAMEVALTSLRDANANAVVLAPGSPPPPEGFWDLCDSLGLVVLGAAEPAARATAAEDSAAPGFLAHPCIPDNPAAEPTGETGLRFGRSAVAWPDSETLRYALPDGARNPNCPALDTRCSLRGGGAALVAAVAAQWPVPAFAEGWCRMSQLAAAGRFRTFAAAARSDPSATGLFLEPLQSPWAAADASAIDCDVRPKALLHEASRSFAPEALFARLDPDGRPEALFVNDTAAARRALAIHWRLATLDGRSIAQGRLPLFVPAFESRRVALPPAAAPGRGDDPTTVALWPAARDAEGFTIARDYLLFAPPRALALHDPALSLSVTQLPDQDGEQVFRVAVSAGAAAFGVRLESDAAPALFDDNDFALDPDETLEVPATPLVRTDPVRFRAALRVTSLYDLAAR